jgi:hypothetical protein
MNAPCLAQRDRGTWIWKNQEIIRENSLGGFVHKIIVVNIPCLQVKADATQMNHDPLNKLLWFESAFSKQYACLAKNATPCIVLGLLVRFTLFINYY